MSRQLSHQIQKLPGGRPRLGLRERRSKLRHHLVVHGNLDARAGVFSNMANKLGQSPTGLADRDFHRHPPVKTGEQCTAMYTIGQWQK